MDAKRELVREFYAARNRRDWGAVRALLEPAVRWHESEGEQDYSGDHDGREGVVDLIVKLVDVTGGTFVLEPQELIATAEHVGASVRWHAERDGTRVEGNDLAVFFIPDDRIAEAWFRADGYDPNALRAVFSFAHA